MPFTYACFISYPSLNGKLGKSIIKRLTTALKDQLELELREGVFLDEERLKPGSRYNEQLARDICQSICWIVVYLPIYEKHPYCNREFTAMEHLAEKRIKLLGNNVNPEFGMIIPIIFRGAEDLPSRIKNNYQCCDFSRFSTSSLDVRQKNEYEKQIREIAKSIINHSKIYRELELDIICDSFELPPEGECPPWRDESKKKSNPLPFHEVNKWQ